MLIAAGAKIEKGDKHGKKPIDYATTEGMKALMNVLMSETTVVELPAVDEESVEEEEEEEEEKKKV